MQKYQTEEAQSESCQTSKMNLFEEIVSKFQLLTFLKKYPSQMFGKVLNKSLN